jgi:hypothetical protein
MQRRLISWLWIQAVVEVEKAVLSAMVESKPHLDFLKDLMTGDLIAL